MNWTANTGTRPSSLKDSDKVFVRLNDGTTPATPWTVVTRVGSIGWGLLPETDTCWGKRIAEWRKA